MLSEFCLESYDYFLPKNLIATYPANPRESAKLLVFDRKKDTLTHSDFYHLFDFIPKSSLIVLNDTKVLKARIYGNKSGGGNIEILYHRMIGAKSCLVQIKGKVTVGTKLFFSQEYEALVEKILDEGCRIVSFYKNKQILEYEEIFKMLELIGHTPLPPYIKRPDEKLDTIGYQSIFATSFGAIAAPTASLHFSETMITYLKDTFKYCFLTLHIGAGTFQNVETRNITQHKIHTEQLYIPLQTQKDILKSETILAIGTTALRGVEYFARLQTNLQSDLKAECDIFLHSGNPVFRVNHLLTNFHLPKSSLLMLVTSMVGLQKCQELYKNAIKHNYRFYSYGDGMLIL